MSENYPLGGTLTFMADDEQETQIAFKPARISKADALQIGYAFCEASEPEREAMLGDLGPVMIRRTLLVLRNVAARVGDTDAAAYARALRDEVEVLPGYRPEVAL